MNDISKLFCKRIPQGMGISDLEGFFKPKTDRLIQDSAEELNISYPDVFTRMKYDIQRRRKVQENLAQGTKPRAVGNGEVFSRLINDTERRSRKKKLLDFKADPSMESSYLNPFPCTERSTCTRPFRFEATESSRDIQFCRLSTEVSTDNNDPYQDLESYRRPPIKLRFLKRKMDSFFN